MGDSLARTGLGPCNLSAAGASAAARRALFLRCEDIARQLPPYRAIAPRIRELDACSRRRGCRASAGRTAATVRRRGTVAGTPPRRHGPETARGVGQGGMGRKGGRAVKGLPPFREMSYPLFISGAAHGAQAHRVNEAMVSPRETWQSGVNVPPANRKPWFALVHPRR